MRWKDFSLKAKILIIIGVEMALFGIASIIALGGIESILGQSTAGNDAQQLQSTLLQREIDHLKWTQTVSIFVDDEHAKELTVTTDHTKCGFGKWYNGDERKKIEEFLPELKTPLARVEEPHRRLHLTAEKILAGRAQGKFEEAREVYRRDTLAALKDVQDSLREVQTVVGAGVKRFTDGVQSHSTWSRNLVIAATLAAGLIGTVLGILFVSSMNKPIRKSVDYATRVSAGDLDATLDIDQRDEIGLLAGAMRSMVGTLKEKIAHADAKGEEAAAEARRAGEAMSRAEEAGRKAEAGRQSILQAARQLEQVVESLTASSSQLSAQVEQSSQGTEIQKERIGETATAMEQMNATVLEVARNASQAADSSARARQKAQEGAEVVSQVVSAIEDVARQAMTLKENMSSLGNQAESIGQVMEVISDIADQTNLLALNAAIEAARAGDAGRGFAVVADEVRKLAEKTMNATKEVGAAIQAIQRETRSNVECVETSARTIGQATELAGRSGSALQEIVQLVDLSSDQVQSIATASEQQSAASDEVHKALEEINRVSSETATSMHHSAQAVVDLSRQSHTLQDLIRKMQAG